MLTHDTGGAHGTSARPLGELFMNKGYSFDFISDKQIQGLTVRQNQLCTGGVQYKTLVLPACKYISLETFEKLIHLASEGATIIIHETLPEDVKGFNKLEYRQNRYRELIRKIDFSGTDNPGIVQAKFGNGSILLGEDIEKILSFAKVRQEPMVDYGLQYIRRGHYEGRHYYIVNWGDEDFSGWIPLATQAGAVAMFNPMTGDKGMAATRITGDDIPEVYIQLSQGESCLLKTFDQVVEGPAISYYQTVGAAETIENTWVVSFVSGVPVWPGDRQMVDLGCWTQFQGDGWEAFSGTAKYSVSFTRPEHDAEGWLLDLGRVYETARVRLNGVELDTLITSPYRLFISNEALSENNKLEVEVTNLMANRIAWMEREGQSWKIFYNINIPNRNWEEDMGADDGLLDPSFWPPMNSGLLGPITLTALESIKP